MNCRESMKRKFLTENEMYFSMLGMQVMGEGRVPTACMMR